MTADLVLSNATVVDSGRLHTEIDIVVQGETIAQLEPAGTSEWDGVNVVDCDGRIVLPAYANVHHHFYSSLLRGAPTPRATVRNQRERLEQYVWPFERMLDRETVGLAVRLGLREAIAAGTTTILDHHVSGGCIDGILDLIAEEVAAAGLRAVLCYEITDRDGPEVAEAGLRETARFLSSLGSGPSSVVGMVGLHAMSTVGPATLARAVSLADRFGVGIHIHAGESEHDNDESVARYGSRPIARLYDAEALSRRTLLAHAVHVTTDEIALLAEKDVLVAHNPRSNASNGIGAADLHALTTAGVVVGVGGDGFTQDIRGELPLMALLQRQQARDPQALPPSKAVEIGVNGNVTIVERLTGQRTGAVAPGYAADLVVLAGEPSIPIASHNVLWHYTNGFPEHRVWDVFAEGRSVLRAGEHTRIDSARLYRDIQARLPIVWEHVGMLV